jgi:hypothetical protein
MDKVTCQKCYGRGWYSTVVPGTEDDYIPDFRETYCELDCDAAKRVRQRDGG